MASSSNASRPGEIYPDFLQIREELTGVASTLLRIQEHLMSALDKAEEQRREDQERIESLDIELCTVTALLQTERTNAARRNTGLTPFNSPRKSPKKQREAEGHQVSGMTSPSRAGPSRLERNESVGSVHTAVRPEMTTVNKFPVLRQMSWEEIRTKEGASSSGTRRLVGQMPIHAHSMQTVEEDVPMEGQSDAPSPDDAIQVFEERGDCRDWTFAMGKPPSVTNPEVRTGPLNHVELMRRLVLDDDTVRVLHAYDTLANSGTRQMMRIEGAEYLQEPGFRIHIEGELAFLYDPMILESDPRTGLRSRLVSWGSEAMNQDVKRYITGGEPDSSPVYHTFSYVRKERAWYYWGRLIWKPAHENAIWDGLNGKGREVLTQNLAKSWRCGMRPERITEMIQSESLKQLCMEVDSNAELLGESQAFKRMNLRW